MDRKTEHYLKGAIEPLLTLVQELTETEEEYENFKKWIRVLIGDKE